MKFIVLSSLLLLVLFAALPAFADEDGTEGASGPAFTHPQPPAHEKKPHDKKPEMQDLKHEDDQESGKKMEDLKPEDGETHHKESHGRPYHHGDDDHKKHDREHDRKPHHEEHHWRGHHVSGWHIFSSIWFFVSVGVLGFFVLFGFVFVMAKICRRRCQAAKAVEGFQPLVETKCPPQLDA